MAVSSTLTYESFLKGRAANILQCFNELLKTVTIADAFGIGAAISTMKTAGDEAALLTAHATLRYKLDAFMTMLQKRRRCADILYKAHRSGKDPALRNVLCPQRVPGGDEHRCALAICLYADWREQRIGDYPAVLLAGLGHGCSIR